MRRIVILDQQVDDAGLLQGDVLFRLDVPAALQQPAPGASSRDPGATTEETNALLTGAVTEVVYTSPAIPQDTPSAYITTQLVLNWQDLQAKLAAKVPQRQFSGAVYDGVSWTGLPA